jgi:hypothetical protein
MKTNLIKILEAARVHRNSVRKAAFAAVALGTTLHASAADRAWNAGNGLWSTPGNWLPLGVPGPADNVFIGNLAPAQNDVVNLTSSVTIAALALTDGMLLDTQNRTLTVNGVTAVSGANPNGGGGVTSSTLWLGSVDGSSFSGATVQLSDGGRLWMDSAYAQISDQILIGADSALIGEGGLNLSGDGSRSLINDGAIAPGTTGLTINQIGDGLIDLDGNGGNGIVHITTMGAGGQVDRLTINGASLADSFSGEIYMRGGSLLNVNLTQGWTADASSLIDISNFAGDVEPALISGGALTIAGILDVEFDTNIAAPATITSTAQIEVGTDDVLNFLDQTTVTGGSLSTPSNIAADGVILLSGPTTWNGTVNIDGIARQMGDALVNAATTINASVFDMDGGGADWSITNHLTINAEAIDELSLPNAFNTQMTIGPSLFSRLTVNLSNAVAWQMMGQMTIIGDPAFYTTRVAGDTTMYVGGDLTLTGGRAHIASGLTLANNSTTTIPAGATLRVGGHTQIGISAEFAGSGTLRIASGGDVSLQTGAVLAQVGIVNEGWLEVSLFPGVASVARFENTAGGTWSVNIAGYAAFYEHDQLIVSSGPAVLGGHLSVNHYDVGGENFVPEVGDEFTILTAVGGVSGAFVANPTSCAAGRTFHWTVLYGSNDVRLRLDAVDECCPPDISGDGNIDLTDLAILLAQFGTSCS